MALETVVFQQDPFINNYASNNKDLYNIWGFDNHDLDLETLEKIMNFNSFSSSDHDHNHDHGSFSGSGSTNNNIVPTSTTEAVAAADSSSVMLPDNSISCRRKRRRTNKSYKNKEEMENQRMTHIAVERNRRRQMNDYLAVLRSLMPPSYAQRGDQASIVGGAINFVKELEHLLQFLESHKQVIIHDHPKLLFTNFFSFPQYSTTTMTTAAEAAGEDDHNVDTTSSEGEKPSRIADIEVTMAESHANIKLLTKRQPKQLLTLITGFHSLSLTVLHLNITTTVHQMILFSFSVKVEDDCQLTSVNDIATAVHELVGMIQEDAIASSSTSSSSSPSIFRDI